MPTQSNTARMMTSSQNDGWSTGIRPGTYTGTMIELMMMIV